MRGQPRQSKFAKMGQDVLAMDFEVLPRGGSKMAKIAAIVERATLSEIYSLWSVSSGI
jgi:hypothetical protein